MRKKKEFTQRVTEFAEFIEKKMKESGLLWDFVGHGQLETANSGDSRGAGGYISR